MDASSLIMLPQWLVFTLVGLPQFSETVYSPSLPDIARDLNTSVSMVEYTLTIYLFAFSLGMLFWGKLSDFYGRRPSMITGIAIYLIGCALCYYSPSIQALLFGRFVQAFGGSAGSVVGQAMLRDVFHGKRLSHAYASMSSALGVPPAIGPIVGGFIAETFGWSTVFLLLILVAGVVIGLAQAALPETLSHEARRHFSIWDIFKRLVTDRKVMVYAWLIGCASGLLFSYFSEGSFYLIELFGLSPLWYGVSFIFIAIAMVGGGRIANWLHERYEPQQVLAKGVTIILCSTGFFSLMAWGNYKGLVPASVMLVVTIGAHMVTMAGRCLVTSTSLSIGLIDYRWCSGTASSVFGFMYYMLASLFTFGIGMLHSGSVLVMPFYFFGIGCSMLVAFFVLRRAE